VYNGVRVQWQTGTNIYRFGLVGHDLVVVKKVHNFENGPLWYFPGSHHDLFRALQSFWSETWLCGALLLPCCAFCRLASHTHALGFRSPTWSSGDSIVPPGTVGVVRTLGFVGAAYAGCVANRATILWANGARTKHQFPGELGPCEFALTKRNPAVDVVRLRLRC
jgi:hypothetical protein